MEQGTHAELLRMRGHYYYLYTQQFRHDLEVAYGVAEEEVSNEKEVMSRPELVEGEAVAAD